MRSVVYTALIGKDPRYQLHEPKVEGFDYVCVTDRTTMSHTWRFEPCKAAPKDQDAQIRAARWVKTHPHVLFPEADLWVWCDHRILPKVPPAKLAELVKDKPIAVFKHPWRDCLYDEGAYCANTQKDGAALIHAQLKRYREQKFPVKAGLVATGAMVLRKEAAVPYLEAWWAEIEGGSRRDQISFPFAVPKSAYAIIPWAIYNPNDHFEMIL